MGAMAKMRNSTPIVLWVLIFSFGVLWVLQDTQVFDAIAMGPANLGSVNGDDITLEEFNNRVSYYVDQYNQQSDAPMPAGMRSSFEEQAWEDLVAERLMAQRMEELGIVVTDRELINMITGENPDPFIRQQFQDETGQIDRVALRAAIEAPENQEIWMMIEQQLRQNRQQQKLSNFVTSSMRVTSRDIDHAYKRQNSYADVRLVRFPYSSVADDEINVSDQEIQSFYDVNQDLFHREENYRFSYVAFPKEPTAEDTLRAQRDVQEMRERFAGTDNHADFLRQVESATSYSDSFVERSEVRDEYAPVLDLEPGEVSDVHMINGDPHMFKLVEEDGDRVKFAILSYQVHADPIATIDRLAEEAEEFSFYAQEDGFETEAETQGYTVRSASATRGTPAIPEIGSARQLVSELEEMRRGQLSDVIELNEMFVVARMDQITPAGPRPLDEVRAQIETTLRDQKRREIAASQARELAGIHDTLDELAEAIGGGVSEVTDLRMGSNTIPDAGREPGVIGAIFGLSEGGRSGILEGQSAAFVVEIDRLELADPSEMSQEQRQQLRQQLEQEKYFVYNSVWIDQMKENARIRDNRRVLIGGR